MKRIAYILGITASLLLASCSKDNPKQVEQIRVGDQDLQEVSLNKLATQTIILKGGDGKYSVNIENSRIAKVSMSRDTMRITGVWEGETYATILSHDYRRHLPIHVVAPKLSTNQEEIRIYPRDESKSLSLQGGGDVVDLKVDDPLDALVYRWNAKTGVVEMYPRYEGTVTFTALASDGTEQKIKVLIKCNGEDEGVGIYNTSSRSISPKMNALFISYRPGFGVILSESIIKHRDTFRYLTITPDVVNPQLGQSIELNIAMRDPDEFREANFKEGKHKFIVEEIRDDEVVLLGQGIKLILPYTN